MIGIVLDGAHWLDAWLKAHLGRIYNAALGIGLGLGISAAVAGLAREIGSGVGELKIAGLVGFQLVLLVNQLAQLHEFREQRRQRRAVRRG